MFNVWCPLSKLIQCSYQIFGKSTKTTGDYVCKSDINKFRMSKLGSFMSFGSLFGVIRNEEKKTKQIDTTEEVLHNVALATIALKDGNVEKSGNILLKSLDIAEANNFSCEVISLCEMLSSLAIKLGDYEKAEYLLKKALDNLRKEGVPENDNYTVSFNLKLSRIYSNQGNDELAENNFAKCLKLQESKIKNNSDDETFLLWSSILYWYGKFLLSKNRFQEAKSCFKDCFLSSSKQDQLLTNQIMVILYNLGEVCEELGEHDEAMEHLLKGISLDKKCQNPDLSYFYSKLGTISMSKGLYKEAKDWCNKAQKFAVRCQNPDAVKESNECLQKLDAFFLAS